MVGLISTGLVGRERNRDQAVLSPQGGIQDITYILDITYTLSEWTLREKAWPRKVILMYTDVI